MKLSEFELDVMQLFWESGDQTASQIHKKVVKRKNVAYTTVKTIIVRLERKGAVERIRVDGRSIVYSPRVTRRSMTKSILPSFLDRFFGGNSTELITQLIEDEELNQHEIDFLHGVLDQRKETDALAEDKE